MPAAMSYVDGLAASPGIAIGRAVCLETRQLEIFRFPIPEDGIDAELDRLDQAVEAACAEIEAMRTQAGEEGELAAIFGAHLLILEDRAFLEKVRGRIRELKVNTEWAVHKTAEDFAERFALLESEHLREKSQDLLDVSRHLLSCLGAISHHELSELESDVIVIAHDLTPSEAIRLGRDRVVGFALESGGRTSHTAIIARSLHLPLVTGLPGLSDLVTDDDPVIINGEDGEVVLHPTPEVLSEFEARRETLHGAERRRLATMSALPAETRDGIHITLQANIDLPEEIDEAVDHGAEGVGLYRSEFLYIERSPDLPTEDEHVEIYRRLIEAMAPHPAVVRTFDLGGRKLAKELLHTEEDNPSLGLRGIRLTLARADVFTVQVRALLRAALHGKLRVMLPMISTVEEIRKFRRLVESTRCDLENEGVDHAPSLELGIMIEVPSAALMARELAREVDFFSIGTNDLIQYSMAVDRNNEHVSHLYQPLHPALLRMIFSVAEGAREAGIDVSVCGESAADPAVACLLVGLGLRKLSMSPCSIPLVKRQLREVSVDDLEILAREALELSTADEIEQRLNVYLSAAPQVSTQPAG